MERSDKDMLQLSVVMPCLDEERTAGTCIDEVKRVLAENGINGEIIVVDNGSQDASADVAKEHGAKVVREEEKGYGCAIRRGLEESCGRVILIGDCDMTYDFAEGISMYRLITREGYDMVIGDRFAGKMERGAMSLTHRVGVRFLSALGRARFHTDVRDFHSGLRALTREAYDKAGLYTKGMEFATEMIAKGSLCGMRIAQIPVTLRCCPIPGRSKLRTIRDGLRHLIYIISHSDTI